MKTIPFTLIALLLFSCGNSNDDYTPVVTEEDQDIVDQVLNIDLSNLPNYADQSIPAYITRDNTTDNPITDEGAILGRVLFYDTNLSSDNTVSCSSCHQQANAFSDLSQLSEGVNGVTARHSMRLINSRFANEMRFFWDERANTLEEQTTQPIQDHAEMGFSGENGAPDFNDLIERLEGLDYYNVLFRIAYGDTEITETRMQRALAQFVRSIQSFDSRYDTGRSQVNDELQPFPNFTAEENAGKLLFGTNFEFEAYMLDGQPVSRRTGGGLNCVSCHTAPEFAINPDSSNNGITDVVNSTDSDFTVSRAPSLRDLTNADGNLNGGIFHTGLGSGSDLSAITDHYNTIPMIAGNNNLDPRLRPGGSPQFLDMTTEEMDQLIAFLKTLSGNDVYTNEKWSDPFK